LTVDGRSTLQTPAARELFERLQRICESSSPARLIYGQRSTVNRQRSVVDGTGENRYSSIPTKMTLDCPKCGRRNVLSEEDSVFFYPRFLCLSCGTRLPIPMSPEDYLKKVRNPDLDRRIQADGSASRPAALKPIPRQAAPGDAG
jgi:hypothetical protein